MSYKDPQYAAVDLLGGNKQLLAMVDHGRHTFSIFQRTWILLNRNYSNLVEGKVFWLHNVVLLEPVMVAGSLKMGQEIRHPEYRFTWQGFTSPVTQNSCFLRTDHVTPPPILTTLTVAVVSKAGLAGGPDNIALGPPYYPHLPAGHAPVRTSCTF